MRDETIIDPKNARPSHQAIDPATTRVLVSERHVANNGASENRAGCIINCQGCWSRLEIVDVGSESAHQEPVGREERILCVASSSCPQVELIRPHRHRPREVLPVEGLLAGRVVCGCMHHDNIVAYHRGHIALWSPSNYSFNKASVRIRVCVS